MTGGIDALKVQFDEQEQKSGSAEEWTGCATLNISDVDSMAILRAATRS
jgi:hypothetical protein